MATSSSSLEDLYARLAPEEEDEEGVIVSEGEVWKNQETFVLVGRFLTEKNINFNAMKNVLTSLWRPKEGVEIHDLGGIDIHLYFIKSWICIKYWMEGHGRSNKIYWCIINWRRGRIHI